MVERLYIHNFKGFVNFELTCGQFVFLMGRNGSGKSSVLEVLHGLAMIISAGNLENHVPPGTRFRFANFPRQEFEVDVRLDGRLFRYRLEIEPDGAGGKPAVVREEVSADGLRLFLFSEGTLRLHNDAGLEKASFPFGPQKGGLAIVESRPENRMLTQFKTWAAGFLLLRLNPWGVGAEIAGSQHFLNVDGSNFAAWLESVAHADTERLLEYFEVMRSVLPGFRSLNWRPLYKKGKLVEADFQADGTKQSFQLDELSEGELSLVVLYAMLHFGLGAGGALALDEPDNYLALAEIEPFLYALEGAATKHQAQVFLVSHHPEIYDRWARDPGRGRYLSRTPDGRFRVHTIDWNDYPELTPAEVVARGWQDA